MKTCWIALVGLVFAACLGASSAWAITPFNKAFEEKYVNNHPQEAFRTAYKKTRCNVCHVKGEPKTVCNAYGNALGEAIPGNAEERIMDARLEGNHAEVQEQVLKELVAAFDEVAKKKIRPADPASLTFGELIERGQLPVDGE
jgi:hypothetical protein